jgi:thioesterase domain-containing protein
MDGEGDVFGFVSLARGLAPAAHYVKEIRSFQPAGSYYVGGQSMGGWVAWEVAQELCRHGQQVATVALVDTQASCRLPLRLRLPMVYARLLRRCFFHLRRYAHVPIREWRTYFRGRMEALRFHLWRIRSTTPAAVRPGTGSAGDYYAELGFRHRPSSYDGAVDLFQCEDASPHGLIAFRGLAPGGVRVHSVTGSHRTMIDEDHLSGFAVSFRQALDAAQQRAPANQNS